MGGKKGTNNDKRRTYVISPIKPSVPSESASSRRLLLSAWSHRVRVHRLPRRVLTRPTTTTTTIYTQLRAIVYILHSSAMRIERTKTTTPSPHRVPAEDAIEILSGMKRCWGSPPPPPGPIPTTGPLGPRIRGRSASTRSSDTMRISSLPTPCGCRAY